METEGLSMSLQEPANSPYSAPTSVKGLLRLKFFVPPTSRFPWVFGVVGFTKGFRATKISADAFC
jgi:hypothetical protein